METDHWQILKNFTRARIAMGRTGSAIPTHELLNFRMAHALARDAVYSALNIEQLSHSLKDLGLKPVCVHSKAESRNDYLLNPNKGRSLDLISLEKLQSLNNAEADLCIIIADGLSANAVNRHAPKVVELLTSRLLNWRIAPVVLAEQGRVALSDPIGEILRAKISLILIGERPGLSSPNSMGAYITYNPKTGNTDERRNCVSNIWPEGLGYELAASKLAYMLNQMRTLRISGVNLKDNFNSSFIAENKDNKQFPA